MAAGSLKLVEDLGMLYTSDSHKYKSRYGVYECYCGNTFKASTVEVTRGHTKSCGCLTSRLTSERNATHLLSNHRLYSTWTQMITRCTNKNHKAYKDYGGRGITVCSTWLDIENFIADMDSMYEEGLTLDRVNVNEGYSPLNCRWVTRFIQAQNVRPIRSTNTSGYKGVTFYKARGKYAAAICSNGKRVHIGYFSTALEAGIAYNRYVVENKLNHSINELGGCQK